MTLDKMSNADVSVFLFIRKCMKFHSCDVFIDSLAQWF